MDDPIPQGGARRPESLERFEPRPEIAISSKRCRICQSPARRDIDALIMIGWEHDYISRFFNHFLRGDFAAWLTPKRVEVHARRHISMDDAHIVEHLGWAVETARALGLLDHEAEASRIPAELEDWLNRVTDQATTALEAGIIVPDVPDLLKATELLERLNTSESARVQNDFARFSRAVMSHVDDKTWAKINRAYLNSGQNRLPPTPNDSRCS